MRKLFILLLLVTPILINAQSWGEKLQDPTGESYPTVVLYGKTWMAKNLNFQVGGSECYYNEEEFCQLFGRLYTQEAATNACRSLGNGWRLPTDLDWRELLGKISNMSPDYGFNGDQTFAKLVITAEEPSFYAVFGGGNLSGGSHYDQSLGLYWSSTVLENSNQAWAIVFDKTDKDMSREDYNVAEKFSVRCVKE